MHASAVLPAKVSVPRAMHALPRARVFKILDRALARGAAWVASPAGAGKTTAVASYLAARHRPALWYDVDANDTDCANVFLYLSSALRAATRSKRRLPAFQIQHMGSIRAFAQKFFEDFFSRFPAGGVLVLDNCHAVEGSEAWTQILDEAARAVPDRRGLIVISRHEPPAPLARSILNERLALVTGNELRFSDAEAAALARARLPTARRKKSSVRALCDFADGWAAGLVLVLDHAARSELAPDFAGHRERLFEYFNAEILAELPPEAQRILPETALLPCMTDAMVTAVSGVAGGGTLLADFHRRGLLVERLATTPATYRYHPLLRAFLLTRETPSVDLLSRAASACAEGEFLDDAIELYARAGARHRIAALILQNAQRLVEEGRYQTLAAWLLRLDDGTIAAEPWLRLWQATAGAPLDQTASQAQFGQAFEGFVARGDAAGLYLSIAGATQVIFIESEDFRRLDPWFRRYEELRRHGPPSPSPDVEAMALTSLLISGFYARPWRPELTAWVERASALITADVGARLRLWSTLVMYHSVRGNFEGAENLLAKMRPQISAATDPITRMIVNEADLHRALIGSWPEVLTTAERGVAMARSEGLQVFEPTNLVGCAQAYALAGDVSAAGNYLRLAAEVRAGVPPAHLFRAGLYEYTQAIVAFTARRFEEAIRLLESCETQSMRTGARWPEILVRTLRCLTFAALDRHADAAREAALMVGDVAPFGVAAAAIELLRVEARLGAADPSGREALSSAMDLGRRYGSYTFFYLRGLPNVLTHGLRDPEQAPWLREHIVQHRVEPWPQHLDLHAWPFAARVRTLGTFALESRVNKGSRKVQRAPLRLLKLLVAAADRALSASDVCETLWSDDPPAKARRTFDTTLHRLRALLGDDVVLLTGGALSIDRARCFVDAWAFASLAERATRELRRAGASEPTAQALDLFADAERLYRGTFLPVEDDLPHVTDHRERLHRRFMRLVLDFAGALEQHAAERAVEAYESALAIDDQAAPLWQGLMRSYLAGGRPADATNAFERCQIALRAAGGAAASMELAVLNDEARSRLRGARAFS